MDKDRDTILREAHEALSAAINDFYKIADPDMFVGDWTLVVHKESSQLHAEGMSAIRWVSAEGQPYHRTVGLLTVASKVASGDK